MISSSNQIRSRHRGGVGTPWCVVLALLVGLVPALAMGQSSPSSPIASDLPTRSATPPYFLVDTTFFRGEDGRPGVRITVSIPYNQLHFVRRAKGDYRAAFDISAIFYDDDENQVAGDVWRHHVKVKRYSSTSSQRRRFSSTQEFVLDPGEYEMNVKVKSFDTVSGSEVVRALVLEEVKGKTLSVTGLEIGTCEDSLGTIRAAEESGFELSWTRRFGEPLPHACARAEVFDADAGRKPRIFYLRVEVMADEQVLERADYEWVTIEARTIIAFDLPIDNLGPGMYEIRLTARRDGLEDVGGRDFEIDASRIDLSRNFDDLAELAAIFLRERVDDRLGDVPVEERRERWNAFWDELDPDPDTEKNELLEEFFRRIRTAASRFGVRGESGWETDRGKVYIRHGEPDDVETIPRGFNTPAYEIWRYAEENLTFVFADTANFGEYILVQPSSPPF